MKRRVTLLAGVFLLLSGLGLGLAQTTVVLNSTYVPWDDPVLGPGWVRVWSQISSKFVQDDAIAGRGLVRFDISHIPYLANITDARLWFYGQKGNSGDFMDIYYVDDDSWNPDVDSPQRLYDWLTTGQYVSTSTGPPGWNSVDITSWVLQDLGTPYLSMKFQQRSGWLFYERIASPTAWYSKHRPYIVVTYTGASPLAPDLTVNRHDIKFNNMWPVPYDPVIIEATVHNVGGLATNDWFYVRFLDNGQPIGSDVRIDPPIPGGGGTATAQITWSPTEGLHEIEVIADPTPSRIPEIKEDNNSNTDNHDPYTFEARGQYKYYVESFESENPPGWWGRYHKDADLKWGASGEEPWEVSSVTTPPPPYDGSQFLKMRVDARGIDDGAAWVERYVPIPATPNATTFVEHSFFAHDGSGIYGLCPADAAIQWFDPDLENYDCQNPGLVSPPTWRRYRSYAFLTSDNADPQPEFWVGGGLRMTTPDNISDYYDLFTVRVGPPRSTNANGTATAYNNGAKFVWDGLSTHHLVYVSHDSILYARSEDPAGDTWSDAEYVGTGQYPAIALGTDGYPGVVWTNGTTELNYRKRSAAGWGTTADWLFG